MYLDLQRQAETQKKNRFASTKVQILTEHVQSVYLHSAIKIYVTASGDGSVRVRANGGGGGGGGDVDLLGDSSGISSGNYADVC